VRLRFGTPVFMIDLPRTRSPLRPEEARIDDRSIVRTAVLPLETHSRRKRVVGRVNSRRSCIRSSELVVHRRDEVGAPD
jgi:hypothetical protein